MKRISFIFLSMLLLLQSCSDISKNLSLAEDLMIERPDSSLMILDEIDYRQIGSRKNMAKYALLYTQAKDKNYIDETDMSLISNAKAYYEDSDDIKSKFLSYYYYGRVLCNNKDFAEAMIVYTQAEEMLEELDDNYLAGLLYTQIGNIYRDYYYYNKCLDAFLLAYRYYSIAELKSHMAYALLDIGIAYWNIEDIRNAEHYIIRALESAIELKDEHLEKVCYENLIVLYDKVGEISKCGNKIDEYALRFNTKLLSPKSLASIASYGAKIGRTEHVDDYLRSAWGRTYNTSDSIALFFQSANIMKTMGQTEEALRYFKEGIIVQNRQLHQAMQQPILSTQNKYFQHQAEYNSYRLHKNKQIYLILTITLLLILLIISMYIRHRFIIKETEISKYIDLASELQSAIQDKDIRLSEISVREEANNTMITEMHSHIAELFHKQYELLDKLSNTYYETHGFSREKDSIYEQVKSEINKFANDKRSIIQLEKIVNTYKRNVIHIIREEIPNISERDIKLLCYIYAGFSAKSISIFIGETTGNILTRKYRLRSKIVRLNTPSINIMLQEMP